jgi:hypothetical protein
MQWARACFELLAQGRTENVPGTGGKHSKEINARGPELTHATRKRRSARCRAGTLPPRNSMRSPKIIADPLWRTMSLCIPGHSQAKR